jgi:hypothetical protein
VTPLKGGLQWAEHQLKDLPTVAMGKVSLVFLDWATLFLVIAMCIWKDTTDSNTTLNAWLLFLAGLHGVSYANFRTAVLSPSTAPSGASMSQVSEQPQQAPNGPAAPAAPPAVRTPTGA